jgi:hypothetical protein
MKTKTYIVSWFTDVSDRSLGKSRCGVETVRAANKAEARRAVSATIVARPWETLRMGWIRVE